VYSYIVQERGTDYAGPTSQRSGRRVRGREQSSKMVSEMLADQAPFLTSRFLHDYKAVNIRWIPRQLNTIVRTRSSFIP
jgi:hypothetical protein